MRDLTGISIFASQLDVGVSFLLFLLWDILNGFVPKERTFGFCAEIYFERRFKRSLE